MNWRYNEKNCSSSTDFIYQSSQKSHNFESPIQIMHRVVNTYRRIVPLRTSRKDRAGFETKGWLRDADRSSVFLMNIVRVSGWFLHFVGNTCFFTCVVTVLCEFCACCVFSCSGLLVSTSNKRYVFAAMFWWMQLILLLCVTFFFATQNRLNVCQIRICFRARDCRLWWNE